MQLRCLLLCGCLAVAEPSFWGSVLGSRSTHLGLEPSSGFLRSSRKAQRIGAEGQGVGGPGDRSPEEELGRALAGDVLAEDAVVLVQQEARLIVDEPREARAPADAFAAARAKLQEPPAEPLRPLSAGVFGAQENETGPGTLSPRVSATERWEEIKAAQQEAKKAAAEGADLLKDESVKHLMSWEALLISNVATGEDEHAQPCIAHCRYGEQVRHSWQECVERCVEDGMTKRMLLVGLPESERHAAELDAPLPVGMDQLKRKRTARRRARSEDL